MDIVLKDGILSSEVKVGIDARTHAGKETVILYGSINKDVSYDFCVFEHMILTEGDNYLSSALVVVINGLIEENFRVIL